MANDKKFVDGMRFTTPRDKAPDWIKGHISVKVDEFVPWAQAHQDERGWLNIDVKESKGGKTYCELDEWRPGSRPPREELSNGNGQPAPPLDF